MAEAQGVWRRTTCFEQLLCEKNKQLITVQGSWELVSDRREDVSAGSKRMKRGGKQTYLMPHRQHCARYSHSCKENKTQWDVKKDREVHKKVQGMITCKTLLEGLYRVLFRNQKVKLNIVCSFQNKEVKGKKMRVLFPISLLGKGLHAYKHIQRSQFAIFDKEFSKDLSRRQMCQSLFNQTPFG